MNIISTHSPLPTAITNPTENYGTLNKEPTERTKCTANSEKKNQFLASSGLLQQQTFKETQLQSKAVLKVTEYQICRHIEEV
jgi:hypothetical protein